MHLASESEPRLILKDRYHPYGIRQQSDAVQRWQVLRHACNDDWMLNINPNGCQLSRHRPSASAIDCAGFELVRDIAPGEAVYIDTQGRLFTEMCHDSSG